MGNRATALDAGFLQLDINANAYSAAPLLVCRDENLVNLVLYESPSEATVLSLDYPKLGEEFKITTTLTDSLKITPGQTVIIPVLDDLIFTGSSQLAVSTAVILDDNNLEIELSYDSTYPWEIHSKYNSPVRVIASSKFTTNYTI